MNEKFIWEIWVLNWKFQLIEKLDSNTFSVRFNNWKENVSVAFNLSKRERAEEYLEYCVSQYDNMISLHWKNASFKENILPSILQYGEWEKENFWSWEDELLDLDGFEEDFNSEDNVASVDKKFQKNIFREWNEEQIERLESVLNNEERVKNLESFSGSVHTSELTPCIRKDLKIYVEKTYAKDLWVKIHSVRKSWDKSIRVEIAYDERYFSEDYLECLKWKISYDEFLNRRGYGINKYSEMWKMILEDVEAIAKSYFYDNSDAMTDYFDYNALLFVSILEE